MAKLELNTEQLAAVNYNEGPLLVVAGAGTGKTGVVVNRINRLLDEGVAAHKILAVTFTEKAAAEMLDRVLESRDDLHAELAIMTFNAFGESILREFSTDVGLSRNFMLLGDSAKIVFLQQHITSLGLQYFSPLFNRTGLVPDVASYFSLLKQHVLTPQDYQKFIASMPHSDSGEQLEKAKHKELADAFASYLQLCKERSVIDYDDQIYRVIELLQSRPNIRTILQDRYANIMVDEFQDTNPMQSRLIDLLISKDNNLMVVGDDDQSIYGFRGATLANILEFKDRYAKAKEVALIENYRNTQAILDASYKLIQNNNPYRLEAKLGINKKLHSQTAGAPPQLHNFPTHPNELNWVVNDIKQRLGQGEPAGDIAILCRSNKLAQRVSDLLSSSGVECVLIGERYQLYKTEVVRMLVETFKCIVDITAETSLYHTLSGALFNIPQLELAQAAGEAKYSHTSLESAILNHDEASFKPAVAAINAVRRWRKEAGTISVGRLAYKIIDETGYKDILYGSAETNPDLGRAAIQLSEFFDTLKDFETIALQPTVIQYLESFAVLEAAGESNEDGTLQVSSDKVNVLTIHKAKGLEWNTVYVPDCSEGSFPMKQYPGGIKLPQQLVEASASAADDHLQEERRLMYVAMTRAKTHLIISYSQTHTGKSLRKPSRFVAEIFTENEQISTIHHGDANPALSLTAIQTATPTAQGIGLPQSMYDGKTLRLSVSKVESFLRCPLDFYYKFILNIPTPASPAASYGSALHETIEVINKTLLEGRTMPPLNELEQQLTARLGNIRYELPDDKVHFNKLATSTLRNFYDAHFKQNKLVPIEVESEFKVRLHPEDLILSGRFDAVYSADKGVEIRDYKTGTNTDTPEKAKRKATNSAQLTLYALVWQQLHSELPQSLSLEYIDTQQIGYVRKTQRGVDTMRQKISAMAECLRKNEFAPGADHTYCVHPDIKN